MMVLRHIVGPPSATVVVARTKEDDDEMMMMGGGSGSEDENTSTTDNAKMNIPSNSGASSMHTTPSPNPTNHTNPPSSSIPIDLSKKRVRTPTSAVYVRTHHHPSAAGSRHSGHEHYLPKKNGGSPPMASTVPSHVQAHGPYSVGRSNPWDEENAFSSPDSGLHGEDEESQHIHNSNTTNILDGNRSSPLSSQNCSQSLIPLSLIRARYNHNSSSSSSGSNKNDTPPRVGLTSPGNERPAGKTKIMKESKRARLEEMVTHIKTTKEKDSGDEESSSTVSSGAGHLTSSDEVAEERATDLTRRSRRKPISLLHNRRRKEILMMMEQQHHRQHEEEEEEEMMDEPCNLVSPRKLLSSSAIEISPSDEWKKENTAAGLLHLGAQGIMKGGGDAQLDEAAAAAAAAAKLYGIDPEAYQQQMMQLQLTSAAMMGGANGGAGSPGPDSAGLMKNMGSYPPWLYLGYYSQLLHSFQAQEILRQYALQSQGLTPSNLSQGEKVSYLDS